VIGRLRGELVELSGALAVVDAGGVGYEVLMPDLVAVQLPQIGEEVTLLIRQIFREDGVSLYGFSEPFQRRMFDLLLGVKGCGPKVALALLGQIGDDAVASAIAVQDSRVLIKAQGVGIKLAERIILELKDKMLEESIRRKLDVGVAPTVKSKPADELVDTLLSLGLRRSEAESAAEGARGVSDSLQEQLKHALQLVRKTGSPA
jgi:holliday junction DNA helicase RuvA